MLADPAQVEQALFNLTNNAIHAIHNSMHSGGKITIRARLALPDLGWCSALACSRTTTLP